MRKVYVTVNLDYTANGEMLPRWFQWEDGRKFPVDRILDKKNAASLKVGGFGLRYKIRVLGKETCLWYDEYEKKWFVEAK